MQPDCIYNPQEETNSGDNLPANSYRIVENPVIVDDGRQLHQLTDEALSADTITLLRSVLNSEYIRIARASAKILSSNVAPLEVHYSEFNGYLELLTRSDIEPALLFYIEDASAEELLILEEMLRRSDMREVLSNAALDRVLTLCALNEQSTYVVPPGFEWVDFGDGNGIEIGGKHDFYFSSGESVNAYRTSREYTTTEQDEQDSRYEAAGLAITRIHDADISYNCHSYAWYRTDNSNSIWIAPGKIKNLPYEKEDDMIIPRTATLIENDDRTTDIVVYYNHLGKILHSAVIVEIDGDNIIVQSKWGKAGVYRHAVDTVPREYIGADGVLRYETYRYHQYTMRTTTDLGHSSGKHHYKHANVCSICGNTCITYESRICSGPPCPTPFAILNEEMMNP